MAGNAAIPTMHAVRYATKLTTEHPSFRKKTPTNLWLVKQFLLPLQSESNTIVLRQDGGFELFDPIVVPDVSLEDKRLQFTTHFV